MQARFNRGVPADARIYRRGYTEYGLENRSFYLQDTFTRKRLTLNLGFRFDHQTDYANAANVDASVFYGKPTFAGVYNGVTYTGAAFNQLPALAFPGADAGVAFNNWSPRAGLTYDLTGNGRSVVKMNFAHYVGQLGTGDMSSTYNTVQLPVRAVSVGGPQRRQVRAGQRGGDDGRAAAGFPPATTTSTRRRPRRRGRSIPT